MMDPTTEILEALGEIVQELTLIREALEQRQEPGSGWVCHYCDGGPDCLQSDCGKRARNRDPFMLHTPHTSPPARIME